MFDTLILTDLTIRGDCGIMDRKPKILSVCCLGLIASALASAQNQIDSAWVQISAGRDGARSHVYYGGSHCPYQARYEVLSDDWCRTLYRAVWGDQFMIRPQVTNFYASDGQILEFKLSPSDTRIALIETVVPPAATDVRLLILSTSGEVLHSIDSARKFAWSPSGDQVAFITGDSYEGGLGFRSTGTSVLDVDTGKAFEITAGGWDVRWASWGDQKMYIWDLGNEGPHVLEYRIDSGFLGKPSHRGIYFSPDGRYYFHPATEGEPFRLFKTAYDAELTNTDSGAPNNHQKADSRNALSFLQSRQMRYAQPRGWRDDHTLVIPHDHSREYAIEYLYDLERDNCLLVNGVVVDADRQEILVLNTRTNEVDMLRSPDFSECSPE